MHMRFKRSWLQAVAVALLACLFVGIARPAYGKPNIWRYEGTSRYETMGKIVKAGFPTSEWAVVATGESFPDALAANALAGARDCPVVLTESNHLTLMAWETLVDRGVKHVYIIGGTSAVSNETQTAIELLGMSTTRIAGTDRLSTSVAAFNEVRAVGKEKGELSDTLIIATGYNFADTLSIGSWSWRTRSPIFLTKSDGTLTDDEVSAIKGDSKFKRVVIVGGSKAVSPEVEDQLGSSYEYIRLEGENRYDTSAKVAEWTSGQGLGWLYATIATGKNFPDALAGAAMCGKNAAVLLLVDDPSDPATNLVKSNVASVDTLGVLGGVSVLPWELVDYIVGE